MSEQRGLNRLETRLLLILLAGLAAGPLIAESPSLLHLLVNTGVTSMTALSLGFTASGTGLIPLGQAAFYGAGAYTAAILTTAGGLPAWSGPILGALTGALLGLVTAFSIRLRDIYYSMATLALATIAHLVALNWVAVTRGPMGILAIPRPGFGAWVLESDLLYLYVVLAALLLAYYACCRISGFRFGRALQAIRHNEEAARAMGINPVACKLKVVVVGGAIAGLAGGLFAQFMGYLSPQVLAPMHSILLLVMAVVGGLNSLAGAALGGALIHVASARLQGIAGYSMLAYGALIVICMVWLPEGLAGLPRSFSRRPSAPDRPGPTVAEEVPHA